MYGMRPQILIMNLDAIVARGVDGKDAINDAFGVRLLVVEYGT